jgi:tRNA-uridine 2-sulfurtransferase
MSFPQMCSSDTRSAFNNRAVALFSGGLDSVLAIYLLLLQGIKVTPLHFCSPFSPVDTRDEDSPVQRCARQLGVEVTFMTKGDEFLELVRNPYHGHGKNLNPCIDCRIYTLRKAKEYMSEIGATFIVTGEVVGQRPMSQRKNTIRMIEKRADCDGIIVRPLSGRILARTAVEEAGIISGDKMLAVAGRGRKAQLGLAREAGITGFSAPAGGCLLTDKIFSRKVRDLFDDQEIVTPDDINLLHVGRHIRIRSGLKIVVGRTEAENLRLEASKSMGLFFAPDDYPAPVILALGECSEAEESLVAGVLHRYTKPALRRPEVLIESPFAGVRTILVNEIPDEGWLQNHMC